MIGSQRPVDRPRTPRSGYPSRPPDETRSTGQMPEVGDCYERSFMVSVSSYTSRTAHVNQRTATAQGFRLDIRPRSRQNAGTNVRSRTWPPRSPARTERTTVTWRIHTPDRAFARVEATQSMQNSPGSQLHAVYPLAGVVV